MIWRCRDFRIDSGCRPIVAGILNATPDSFSDGGLCATAEQAVARGKDLLAQGADVIDVGGESTRPGAAPVDAATELDRILPVVEALAQAGAPVSVDTRRAEVARAALRAGAAIVNNPAETAPGDSVARAAAEYGAGYVATWSQGCIPARKPAGGGDPDGAAERAAAALRRMAEAARGCGVPAESIVLDPGLGFGKSPQEDFALMRAVRALSAEGPVMIGISRKSALGAACAQPDPALRLGASVSAALWTAAAGAAVLRVHDVRETVQALRVWRILEDGKWMD